MKEENMSWKLPFYTQILFQNNQTVYLQQAIIKNLKSKSHYHNRSFRRKTSLTIQSWCTLLTILHETKSSFAICPKIWVKNSSIWEIIDFWSLSSPVGRRNKRTRTRLKFTFWFNTIKKSLSSSWATKPMHGLYRPKTHNTAINSMIEFSSSRANLNSLVLQNPGIRLWKQSYSNQRRIRKK